ncbi:MAG: DUF5320 domain-containing protein [Bacilli bacterium]
MARRDGTGPLGQGPMTGRGLGNCNDDIKVSKNNTGETTGSQSNNQNTVRRPIFGRGLGLGRRNSRGFRNRIDKE